MPKFTILDLSRLWGVSPRDLALHMEWLAADPRDEQGRLTREMGIRHIGAPVERLVRHHSPSTTIRTMEGRYWPTSTSASVSAMEIEWPPREHAITCYGRYQFPRPEGGDGYDDCAQLAWIESVHATRADADAALSRLQAREIAAAQPHECIASCQEEGRVRASRYEWHIESALEIGSHERGPRPPY